MDEYKICPVCETKNSPDAELCDNCGVDISGEPIISDIMQAAQNEEAEASAPALEVNPEEKADNHIEPAEENTENIYRVCDECGYPNPRNARKCQKCGSDISDIVPTAAEAEPEDVTFELRSEDGAFSYTIPEGETIIGREHELKDYLKDMMFVSRRHGKLIYENGAVYYEDLGSTNGTLLNHRRVSEKRVRLINGDRLYLGHNPDIVNNDRSKIAYFVFVR